MPERTKGDILKVYVMPPSTAFPWIRLTHHPYGIKHSGVEVDAINADRDRETLARMIGEMVINHSPILQAWTAGN